MKKKIKLIKDFKYICICDNKVTIIGHSIEPKDVVSLKSIEKAMNYFNLSKEEVNECFLYLKKY